MQSIYHLAYFNKHFNIIAITETQLQASRGIDFDLQGYKLKCVNRESSCEGGVALFVDRGLTSKVVENMSIIIDNIMECITIEICMEKMNNVIVSCVYRKPGSKIETFKENMKRIFTKEKQSQLCLWGF